MDKAYIIEASAQGCTAEVRLNDIPVVTIGEDHPRKVALPCHENLIDGENTLSIRARPGKAPAGASLACTLKRYAPGAIPGDGSGVELLSCTREEAVRKDLGVMFGPWAWQSAPRLDLEGRDRADIIALIESLHADLKAKRVGVIIDALRPRIGDIETAYGLPPQSRVAMFSTMLERQTAKATWEMEPLNPGAYDLRPCADGRMVECRATDGRPILRQRPVDGGGVSFPLIAARLNGRVVAVRG